MGRLTHGTILALFGLASLTWAHGGGHSSTPPPPPHPPPPPPTGRPPNSGVPPGLRPPSDPPKTPTPPPEVPPPPSPTTPAPTPAPKPPAPPPKHTPTPTPAPPAPTPGAPVPTSGRPDVRKTRPAPAATSWRTWWEFNREYLLGLRQMIRHSGTTTTGPAGKESVLESARPRIRQALRVVAQRRSTDPQIRGAALIALGRVGTQEDAEVFLSILWPGKGDPHVQSMAALGLGLLPAIEDPAIRTRVREHVVYVAAAKGRDVRVRGFTFIAAGMRARTDNAMAMGLARQCTPAFVKDGYDAASLAFACGVSRNDLLVPELVEAARKSQLGGKTLNDIGRAHAATGLGLVGSSLAFDTLVSLLRSRRAGIETRRAAALGMGRLLREVELTDDQRKEAERTLVRAYTKGRDPHLRAYALVALAGARRPLALAKIEDAVATGSDPTVRPYAALCLGLAARRVVGDRRARIQKLLLAELNGTKDIEFASALTLAVGMAGAADATADLVSRVEQRSSPAAVRAAAAEALGLLQRPSPPVMVALLGAFRDDAPRLVESATLALGLLGRRGLSTELIDRLQKTSSGPMQGRLTLSLAYLGRGAAVEPLLALLQDRTKKRVVRELAAVALGLIADPQESDVLFELEAYYNYAATTVVTHELLSIF